MARKVEDLALGFKHFLVEEVFNEDYTLAPVQWNEELYTTKRKLKIGYVDTDSIFKVI